MRLFVYLMEGQYSEDNQIILLYSLNESVLQYSDNNETQSFVFDSLNTTIIDYNVYGKQNSYYQSMGLQIDLIDDKIQLYSYPKGNFSFNLTYQLKLEVDDDFQNKALVYSLIVSFLAFIQVVCCIKIYRDILTDERNASQYSLITIVLITTYDTYLSLVHFYFSIDSQYFITPSFLYFILFSLMELKLLTIIWKERFSSVHDNILLRRELYKFYFKFYAAMIIILIMMYKYIYYNSFLLLTCFFMLPQIVHIARKGQQVDFDKIFIFGFLTTRLFIPLYFRGYEGNFAFMRPSIVTCFAIITIQTVLIYMYYMQCEYGPRYWVPKFLRPQQHEYFVDSSESEGDCAVCMGSVQKQATETVTDIQNRHQLKMIERESNKIMKTPCNHYFHVVCLVRWMAVKMTCPTCRQDLPSAL